MKILRLCPVCAGKNFSYQEVLWKGLVSDWQLSACEIYYINSQQGVFCVDCANNQRSIALAEVILFATIFPGHLRNLYNLI